MNKPLDIARTQEEQWSTIALDNIDREPTRTDHRNGVYSRA
ncbi:hypothetical protein [Nocardiopsis alba]